MRTTPNTLPMPDHDQNLVGMKTNRWAVFLRLEAPEHIAIRLHTPVPQGVHWGKPAPAPNLRLRKPEFVLVPQRTANELFPDCQGWAEPGLTRWCEQYALKVVEMPQHALLGLAQNANRHTELARKVAFLTARAGEQISATGFAMTWANYDRIREIQRQAAL